MTFTMILATDRPSAGAETLRQRARWAEAERRWHGADPVLMPDHPSPPDGPFGGRLENGAQLTRFTNAGSLDRRKG